MLIEILLTESKSSNIWEDLWILRVEHPMRSKLVPTKSGVLLGKCANPYGWNKKLSTKLRICLVCMCSIDQLFTLRLIINKCLCFQTPLVLSFIYYQQAFNSVDRRALAKALSLYAIPDKYIKVISALYKNNTAGVKVGNEVTSWFCIKSGIEQGCVLSPFMWIILMDFVLRSKGKAMGDHRIKRRGKALQDLDYADDLSILDESVSKMIELLDFLWV